MAIRAYITTLVSSIQAAENIEEKHKGLRFTKSATRVADNNGSVGEGRRLLLLSTIVAAATDSKTQLLQKYLKKSEENKTKNDKEVLIRHFIVFPLDGMKKKTNILVAKNSNPIVSHHVLSRLSKMAHANYDV